MDLREVVQKLPEMDDKERAETIQKIEENIMNPHNLEWWKEYLEELNTRPIDADERKAMENDRIEVIIEIETSFLGAQIREKNGLSPIEYESDISVEHPLVDVPEGV